MSEHILNLLLGILSTAITGVITGVLIPAIATWVKSKTTNQRLQSVIDDVTITVKDSVNYVEQTIVKKYKEDGKWDADAQQDALESAIADVINNLTASTKAAIEKSGVDIYSLLYTKVESYILSSKGGNK